MLLCLFCQDDAETAGFALDGLKQVMAVKSRSVLPYLVPKVSHQHPHLPSSPPPAGQGSLTAPSSPADRSARQHGRAGLPVLGGRRRSHAPPRGHPARAALLPQGEAGDGGRGSGKDHSNPVPE